MCQRLRLSSHRPVPPNGYVCTRGPSGSIASTGNRTPVFKICLFSRSFISLLNSFFNSLFDFCSQATKTDSGNQGVGGVELALIVNVLESPKSVTINSP